MAAQHQLLVATDLVGRRLACLLVRLIWDAEGFREAECGFLMVSEGLVDLPQVKVVRNQVVGGELRIV
mgnify:FL=1